MIMILNGDREYLSSINPTKKTKLAVIKITKFSLKEKKSSLSELKKILKKK